MQVFARYIAFKREAAELLFFVLQELAREALHLIQARANNADGEDQSQQQLSIPIHELELRAREVGIQECRQLLSSRVFVEAGWRQSGEHMIH